MKIIAICALFIGSALAQTIAPTGNFTLTNGSYYTWNHVAVNGQFTISCSDSNSNPYPLAATYLSPTSTVLGPNPGPTTTVSCVAGGGGSSSGNAITINGGTVPANAPCVATNSSSQLTSTSCGGGSLPSATALGQHLISSGVGSTYTAQNVAVGLPVPSPIAEYHFTEGSGTSLVDYSGSGLTGTLGASTAAPTWTPTGLSFNGGNLQTVSLPSAILTTVKTVIVIADSSSAVASGNTGSAFQPVIGRSSNSSGFHIAMSDGFRGRPNTRVALYYGGGGSYLTESADTTYGPSFIGYVLDATADVIYINGKPVQQMVVNSGNLNAITRTGNLSFGWGAGDSGVAFTGTIYFAAFYSTELTAAQMQQEYQYAAGLVAARGVSIPSVNVTPTANLTSTSSIVVGGDSISAGCCIGGIIPWPFQANFVTNDTFTVYDFAINGNRLQWIKPAALQIDGILAAPLAKRNVFVLFAGTNDFADAGETADQVYRDLSATAKMHRVLGEQVVVVTMISRTGQDTNMQALNKLILANWPAFADAVADTTTNANIGVPGANASATYFQPDNVHPTNAGQAILATIISTAINQIPYGPGVVTTPSHGAFVPYQISAGLNSATNTCTGVTPNQMQYIEITLPFSMLVSAINYAAFGGGASGDAAVFGWYDRNGNLIPNAYSRTVDLSATAFYSAPSPAPFVLPPGVYYFGYAASAAFALCTAGQPDTGMLLNASGPARQFTGSTAPTGSGSSYTPPTSIGTMTKHSVTPLYFAAVP